MYRGWAGCSEGSRAWIFCNCVRSGASYVRVIRLFGPPGAYAWIDSLFPHHEIILLSAIRRFFDCLSNPDKIPASAAFWELDSALPREAQEWRHELACLYLRRFRRALKQSPHRLVAEGKRATSWLPP